MKEWLFPHNVEREYQKLLQAYADDISAETEDALDKLDMYDPGNDSQWSTELNALLASLLAWGLGHATKVINALPTEYAKINRFNDDQFVKVVKDGTGLTLPKSSAPDIYPAPMPPKETQRPSGNQNPMELDKQRPPPPPPSVTQSVGTSDPRNITLKLGTVDVYREEPWWRGKQAVWIDQNTAIIKTIPGQHMERVQVILREGVMQGRSPAEIAKDIQEVSGITKRRAAVIARDQTGKANAALSQARMEELGIENYIWVTSHDERVRPTHRASDGNQYSFETGSPHVHGLNPGQDILCRCWARPVFPDDEDDSPDSE
jgi:SPP1 gp7 family putative phage head morphogenesis protein